MASLYRLDRTLIRISGADALGFLDNLLTQDLTGLPESAVKYAALLTPQGKVLADMMLYWQAPDTIVITADPQRSTDLQRRLTMYKLRARVEIANADDLHEIWSEVTFDGALADPRLPALGYRKLAPRADAERLEDAAPHYEALRFTRGVPDLGRDIAPDEAFALEALLEELNGVDFQKGCFVGQENVSRMKRRATTRRKLCPVNFEGPPPTFGAPIQAGPAEIGSIRHGGAGRAIAFLRLDRAREALSAGQTLTAEGRPLQLDPPAWLIQPDASA